MRDAKSDASAKGHIRATVSDRTEPSVAEWQGVLPVGQ